MPSFRSRLCRHILAYEWLFLLLLLPAVLFPSPRSALLLLLLPLFWVLRKVATGHFVPPTPLNLSLLLLLLTVLVSLYATFDFTFSFGKIAGLVYGVAWLFAVVAWIGSSGRRLWLGTAGLLLAGVGIALLGLLLIPAGAKIPLVSDGLALLPTQAQRRFVGDTDINPNQIAGVLLWVVPLALALAAGSLLLVGRLRHRVRPFLILPLAFFLVVTAALVSAVLLLTQSRSAYLGLAAALLFLAVVPVAAISRRLLLASVTILLALSLFLVLRTGPQTILDRLLPQTGPPAGDVSGLAGRLEIWSRALYGIEDFPITGMGMNNFRRIVHILYPLFSFAPEHDIAHAHNQWLQTALDLGLPGLIAYLALWLGLVSMLWRSWQQANSVWQRLLSLGLASCLVAYFVYGLTDTVALGARPGFLFWYLLGLIAALHAQVATPPAAAHGGNGS